MRKNLYILGLLFFFSLPLWSQVKYQGDSWSKVLKNKKGTVKVVYCERHPFIFKDKKKGLHGIEHDLIVHFKKFIKQKYNIDLEVQWVDGGEFVNLYENIENHSKGGVFAISAFSNTPERRKKVGITPSYLPDVSIIVSSSNIPIYEDTAAFIKKFNTLTAVVVEGTTFEKGLKKLKKHYLHDITIRHVPNGFPVRVIDKEDNTFSYVDFPLYILSMQEGLRMKRQSLFSEIMSDGYAFLYPKSSDWNEPWEVYFNSKEYKNYIDKCLVDYLGEEIIELTAHYTDGDSTDCSKEIAFLTKEKEIHYQELLEAALENQKKSLIVNVLIFGFIMLIFLALILYNRYYFKKKSNELLQKKNLEIARQRDHITESVNYAQKIQQSILPSENFLNKVFNDHFILYRPKDIISGDFYWCTHIKELNKIFFAVIDCTGHGIPGALMAMICYALLNEIINNRGVYEPSDVLEILDKNYKSFFRKESSQQAMVLSLCLFEPANDQKTKLTFAGAKQGLYYITNNTLKHFKGSRRGIGSLNYKDVVFETKTAFLNPNDMVYITTDGLVDQNSPEGRKFSSQKLKEILIKIAGLSTNDQKETLTFFLEEHQKDSYQRDDITFVGIKM